MKRSIEMLKKFVGEEFKLCTAAIYSADNVDECADLVRDLLCVVVDLIDAYGRGDFDEYDAEEAGNEKRS